jgi:Zn-dependent protease
MSVLVGSVAGLAAVWPRAAGFGALVVASLVWLAGVNVVLGVFNLLPGATLDGQGRGAGDDAAPPGWPSWSTVCGSSGWSARPTSHVPSNWLH